MILFHGEDLAVYSDCAVQMEGFNLLTGG